MSLASHSHAHPHGNAHHDLSLSDMMSVGTMSIVVGGHSAREMEGGGSGENVNGKSTFPRVPSMPSSLPPSLPPSTALPQPQTKYNTVQHQHVFENRTRHLNRDGIRRQHPRPNRRRRLCCCGSVFSVSENERHDPAQPADERWRRRKERDEDGPLMMIKLVVWWLWRWLWRWW